MEWTKLWANLWGSTSSVTLFSPWKTFAGRKLFAMEHSAAKKREEVLEKAGIPIADIKWVGSLRFLTGLPGWVSWIPPVRWAVGYKTASERNNQPSAAAREIAGGFRKVEPTIYYHEPMYKLAEEHGLEDPVDRALNDILIWHQIADTSLNSTSESQRKNLLSEVIDLELRDVYIPSSRFVRLITEGWFKFLTHNWFGQKFEVSGLENLQAAASDLEEKKSILVIPNHRANPDHIAQALAIRQALGDRFPLIIVAGMLFEKEWLSRMLGRAYDRLLVWTVKDNTDKLERRKADIIIRRSDRRKEELLKESVVMLAYLEGGRTKPKKGEKPQLQKPVRGGSLWLKNPRFGRIVPAINIGTEKMQRPGSIIPGFASVTTRFGQPRDSQYFREEAAKEASFKKRDGYVSNLAMKDIAAMLPEDERGVFSGV